MWRNVIQTGIGLFLTSATFSFAAQTAKEFEIHLDSSRKAVVYRRVSESSRNWIVFLPGQGCGNFDPTTSRWIPWLQEYSDFGVLVINKAGTRLTGTCHEDEFQRSSVRSQRIADALSALKALIPADAHIFLLGESEGGYIAPDIANLDSRVTAVVMLSSGSRSWLVEEAMLRKPSERKKLWRFFERNVIGNESLTRFFDETSYAQLNSYHTHKTYAALKALTIPVLMLNGETDRVVWIPGLAQDVGQLLRSGKHGLELHVFPHLIHGLICDSECRQSEADAQLRATLIGFVEKVLKKSCTEHLQAARSNR